MGSPFFDFSSIKGVILDWDGVIAETKLDFSPIREKYFGGKRVPLLEAAEHMPEPLRTEYMKDICDEEMRGAAFSVKVPGIDTLISALDARGIEWCIHSRNCLDSIVLAARTIGFALPKRTFSREAAHVKPDCRAMLDAAEMMRVSASECLAVGDYLYELIAARRCGMRCALVRNDDPECTALADAAFPDIDGLTRAISNGLSIIPWEYMDAAERHGAEYVKKCHSETVHVDIPLDAVSVGKIFDLASAGLGRLTGNPKRRLTLGEIIATPLLGVECLEMDYPNVLRKLLSARFPLLETKAGDDGTPLSSLI